MSSLIHLISRGGLRLATRCSTFNGGHFNGSHFNGVHQSSLLKNLRPNAVPRTPTYSTRCLSRPAENQTKLLRLSSTEFACHKQIRTTNPNRVPPIFWLLIRPVLNAAAILGGKRVRVWWRALPEERRQYYRNKIRTNKRAIYGMLGGLFVLSAVYYAAHLEEAPITKRNRFVAISQTRYNELSDLQFEAQLKMFQNKLLPTHHPYCRTVERVARRIIESNLDIKQFKEKHWTTAVVDAPHVKNAMVVGDGKIFVFTGMLNLCENDDQLGFVLSHEIAHSILSHGIEILSQSHVLSLFVFFAAFFIWSVFPTDLLAGIGHFLTSRIIDILFNLPFSRDLEIEADKVAMLFAAKSCFDVREGVAFWQSMAHHEKVQFERAAVGEDIESSIEFLSTHPSHDKRAEYLESMLKETLELREKCNCPRLPRVDPVERVKRQIERNRDKKRDKNKQQQFTVIKV